MLGFPKEFEEPFFSAWTEPFTGFELKWIEVEICRQAMIPTNISDLFEKMKAKYPDLKNMHQSKFYRIVASLVNDGYLKDTADGRSKIIQTLPAGIKEFGRITRYFFEIQMERMKSTLWHDMIEKVSEISGCLLEQECLVLGPEFNAVNVLIQECSSCLARGDLPLKQNIEEYKKSFRFLDYQAIVENKGNISRIESIDNVDDWPYKEDYIDVVILLSVLSTHSNKAIDILNEAQRVIKPGGYVILFEVTQEDSKFVTTLMREATTLMNFTNPGSPWQFPPELPKKTKLVKDWIEKTDLSIVKEFPDVISTIIVMTK